MRSKVALIRRFTPPSPTPRGRRRSETNWPLHFSRLREKVAEGRLREPYLLWQFVVYAFDVPVHAEDVAIAQGLASFTDNGSILTGDRTGEGMKFT
jgi:hypothetical protein